LGPDDIPKKERIMVKTVNAVFDGTAFRPEEHVDLKPNTRVRIVVEIPDAEAEKAVSFLDTARSLNLEGPPDWSERFEEYLYDRDRNPHG
jgi:predicted DNA-binding antitoxin AbrB/MazE fold protein